MVGPADEPHGHKKDGHLQKGLGQAHTDPCEGDKHQPEQDNDPGAEAVRQHGHGDLPDAVGNAEGRNEDAGLEIIEPEAFPQKRQYGNEDTGGHMMAEMGQHELGDQVFGGNLGHFRVGLDLLRDANL